MSITKKNILAAFGLWLFASCSSGTQQKEEPKATNTTTTSVDSLLHGLTGVIEKNPPVMNGDYVSKYPNGIIKLKGYYIKGRREGEWVGFFENGKVQSEGFFKNGLRDGKAVIYYENGQIYYTGYYKDGREVGKWIVYDPQGKKINEKDYGGEQPNS